MTISDIIALGKMGYTKTDIDKMSPKPEAPKPEAPKPEAPKPEAPKPEAPKPEENTNTQILEAIKNLTTSIQNMNINNTNMPKEDSAYDIMANIINPKEV